MQIHEFQLDAFRGGNSLRFVDVGEGLNVALARSTEGSMELLHVVPATLFGNGRYFSSVAEEVLAGTVQTALMLRTDAGNVRLARRWNGHNPPPRRPTGARTG